MSLGGVFQGQECFNSIGNILIKDGTFQSLPEFDGIFYPYFTLDDLDKTILDIIPPGMEEGKHIWDFRYNSAGWNIEKINNELNFLTEIFIDKPKESIKRKIGIIWSLKKDYKKICIIPFELSARIFTSLHCNKKNMKAHFNFSENKKKIWQIIENLWREKKFEIWREELDKSEDMLNKQLYKDRGVTFDAWEEKMRDFQEINEKKKKFDLAEYFQIFFIPLTYSLNPPPIDPAIYLFSNHSETIKPQINPLDRLVHALLSLEKLSAKDIFNLDINGIKKQISANFEKFSCEESLKSEQNLTRKTLYKHEIYPISFLSLRADIDFCNIAPLGYSVSRFKYMFKELPQNHLTPSLMIYGNTSDGYYIQTNNDGIGILFFYNLYYASLADNILTRKRECPFKGSNFEVKCEKCSLITKKTCKKYGNLNP